MPGTRRIVLAVDASPVSASACAIAAGLAHTLGAELVGVFVEDEDLLRAASNPITQLVGAHSARVHRFSTSDLERQLRSQAARARADLERAARAAQVRAAFRVMRGQLARALAEAAADAQLLGMSVQGWTSYARSEVGAALVALASHQPPRQILIAVRSPPPRRPLRVVVDSAARVDALADATALLAPGTTPELWPVADERAGAAALAEQLRVALAARGVRAIVRTGGPLPPAAFGALGSGGALVVVAADSPVLAGGANVDALIAAGPSAVLLVPPSPGLV